MSENILLGMLVKSPITKKLKSLGLSESDLASIQIEPANDVRPMRWPVSSNVLNIPFNEHFIFTHAYALYRWWLSTAESDDNWQDRDDVIKIVGKVELKCNTSVGNAKNAKKDRKDKPTKEVLEHFRVGFKTDYISKHGVDTDRGWKKQAKASFGLDGKTLNKILKS